MRLSIAAGGSGALFLTVCGIQPIFSVFLMNHLGVAPARAGALLAFLQLTAVFQLASILAYSRLGRRKPFWLALHIAHRAAGVAIAAAAVVSSDPSRRGQAARIVFIAITVSWALTNLSSSGWTSWMADLIPEDTRGSFFLRRSSVYQAVTVAWFFLASVLLDLFPPGRDWVAYAVIYGVGALGGLADILLHIPIPEPSRRPSGGSSGGSSGGPSGGRQGGAAADASEAAGFLAPLRDANFLRFSFAVGLGVLALYLANPFQAPYLTSPRGIGAPNVWLGIMTVISQLTWVAIAPLWGFVMDRYGRKPVVALGCLTALGLAGYALLTPRDYVYVLPLVALVTGFFGPAFWEGSTQLMLTLAPRESRVVYIAWYNTIVGLVSAAGPLAGGALAEALAGLDAGLGTFRLRGFHVGQLAGLALMALAALALRKVREGRERPVAYLAGQFATASVFRSYASVGALGRDSGDPRVARALRRLEGGDGDLVLREVLARLDDPSPEVREEAARALGRIGSREATEELVSRLSDPFSAIRIEAARALGRIGDERALPALAALMGDLSPELRAACAEAIGGIGGEAARNVLLDALGDEADRRVLAAGSEAITRSPEPGSAESRAELLDAAQELFARLVDARNPALERQYAIALGNLLGKPAEFYRFITGEGAARSERCAELLSSFRRTVNRTLAGDPGSAQAERILGRLQGAIEAGRGGEALSLVLALHGSIMARIFGEEAGAGDFALAAARVDLRLGAWAWIAAEAGRLERHPAPGFDELTRWLVALLGMYYLSSA